MRRLNGMRRYSNRSGMQRKVWSGIKAFKEAKIKQARYKRDRKKKEMIKKVNDNDVLTCMFLSGLKSPFANAWKRKLQTTMPM